MRWTFAVRCWSQSVEGARIARSPSVGSPRGASSLPEADITLTHSLLCGKTRRQSVFAERKLSSFDGAQSTRFAAFPSTHRSICLDYWHPRLQKHNPQSFSEGGFVRFPSICAWQLYSSARGFRIYPCFAVSRTRAQFADFSSLRRFTPWTLFKSHIGLIRLKCQHQHEDTRVRWVLSRMIMTALIFRVVSKDLL